MAGGLVGGLLGWLSGESLVAKVGALFGEQLASPLFEWLLGLRHWLTFGLVGGLVGALLMTRLSGYKIVPIERLVLDKDRILSRDFLSRWLPYLVGVIVCTLFCALVWQIVGFSEPAIGICIKIHDGATRALGPVCVEVFKQLGIIDRIDNFPYLKVWESPEVRNNRDIVTGKIVAEFKLKKA